MIRMGLSAREVDLPWEPRHFSVVAEAVGAGGLVDSMVGI